MPKMTAEQREARREHILLAAMRCVAREGFHKTSMAQVIQESGLSAGAVYGYFRSKDEIIAAIADRAIGIVAPRIEQALSQQEPPSPSEVIHIVTQAIVDHPKETGIDITRVAVAAWAEAVRDENIRAVAAEKIGYFRDLYANVLRHQQETGNFDADADIEHGVQALFALMPGFILQRLIFGDLTPETYVKGIRALGIP